MRGVLCDWAIIPYVFDFHEKRRIKSWVFSKLSVGVLLLLSALLSASVYERYQKERETARTYRERAAEHAALEAQAAALEARVQYIQSERGIEEEIRERYDAIRDGERTVVVLDAPEPAGQPSRPAAEQVEKRPARFSWLFFWR